MPMLALQALNTSSLAQEVLPLRCFVRIAHYVAFALMEGGQVTTVERSHAAMTVSLQQKRRDRMQ